MDLVEELIKIVDSKETYPYLKFGVKYAFEIKNSELSPSDIIKRAGLKPSFQVEIHKGIGVYEFLNK